VTSVGDTFQLEGDLSGFQGTRPGICASACAFAFMGGVDRSVGEGDRLGMHQFFTVESTALNSSDIQKLVGITLIHTLRMGIDPIVIAAASTTSSEDMYFFSQTELVETDLVTAGRRQDDWKLIPDSGGLFLETTYYGWANQIVRVRIFCVSGEQNTRILYVEENEFQASRLSLPLIERFGDTGPHVIVDDHEMIQLRPSNVGFQHVGDGSVAIALNLPSRDMLSFSGLKVRFDPAFPISLGNLLHTEVTLPPREWMDRLTGNCMYL
jgi:hypothetical protein